MSLHHENLAWPLEMPAMRKFVMVAVYRFAARPSMEIHTTASRLASTLGMSESTVRQSLHELEQAGHIVQLPGRGRGAHYRLVLAGKVAA